MMKKLIIIFQFLLIGISMIVAQNTQVKGTVTSGDDGLPIPGASVAVKGTTLGTITDVDGNFSLSVPANAKILQISFVGMKTQEVAVKPVIAVVLQSDVAFLDEVVVTAQGLTRKEKSLGYATQQVKAEDLQAVRQTDLNNALVGKVAGVRFLGGSGAKFDAGKIVLRGTSSLTDAGGSEPLYVVDGIITNANSINMDDVEAVNVLKGPAATALYGSRGGNGAIIITTKGLTGEKSEFNVSHTLSFEKVYLHNDIQKEYGGGYYGADAEMDVFHYDPARHPSYLQALDGVQYYDYADDASWGPKLDGREYAPWYAWDPTSPLFGKTDKWTSKMNLNDLFDTGVTNTTNLSFARSGKDYMTRVSFTNSARDGVAPNSNAVRRFLSAKTQFKPMDRLTISLDYKYTYRKNHNAAVEGYSGAGNVLYSYQQWGHTNVDLSQLRDYKRPDGTFRSWNITSPTNLTPQFHDNPFALYNEINNTDIYQWNVFSADAQLELPWNIKAGVKMNGNIRNQRTEGKMPMNVLDEVSTYNEGQNSLIDMQVQGRLTWGGRFVDDRLSIDAALFLENRNYTYNEVSAFTRDGLFLDKFFSTAASVGLAGGSNSKTDMKEQSIYGTGTFGWDDTYYLDFSLRNDWTSTLHPDRNSYLYGGLSAAVMVNNWMKDVEWLDYWKVRGSMAQVGSTMSAYNVYPTYKLKDADGNVIKYGSLSNLWNDTNLKDPYIKPTISTSFEVGTEFKMFGNRFWGDFNFYNRDSKDQIINVNTTPASGYRSRKMNAGLIRNRGIELSLGGTPVSTRDWTWDINANVARNRNTLEELVEGQDTYQIYWMSWSTRVYSYAEVGKPIGVIRGSTWAKDPEGRIILSERADPNHVYGPYAPLLDASAQEELGNIQPDLTGGFSTSLRYKNFRLSASFDFQIGGEIASATNMFGEGSGLLTSTVGLNDKGNPIRNSVADGGGVRMDGVVDNGDGTYRPVTAYVDANYYYQSRKSLIWEDYVYDASYLKMRELSVTYDVPTAFLDKTKSGIKKASLSFVAQNPWLIYSGVPNIDPSESGGATYNYIEGGQAASTRSFGLTVNLTF
ncbi:SusC/RagA family TonB-linked outer membrane protein [Parabacteroides acidifaciens]|uniref:SusC/RagA family TonB-linked outer membrane protein n=1 Tax=Parabacteroides acidifaciens TaxID=2290935 RepID=A0A3D8HFI6_9BACT|nr:SusC/RagA family TonB-linked outer membrane protein [Parabacteroides acidifaciens]MBC8601836.1 SusC/RagA family TonB-linked outer membrane protein [Parabacteroides acidifaciens]RDU49402.1 SusC/RagA family TonB-linked outer membrane protein [Parabacteroides acidifaciens]